MLAYIQGKILKLGENFCIVENQGLGYKVFLPKSLILGKKNGDAIELYLYHHIREDLQQLFGFMEFGDLGLFELLISVSGVGPKTAMNVFSESSADEIKTAIIHNDAGRLQKVSGIGKKTAERIVLELQNKVDGLVGVSGIRTKNEMNANSDAIEALTSLGYSLNQVKDALRAIDPGLKDTQGIVKAALKILR
jgi:holliday junction DNA helicase RuvA